MYVIIKNIIYHPVFKNNIVYSGGSYIFRLFNTLIIFSILARIYSVQDFGMISFFLGVMKIVQTGIDYGHRISIVNDLATNRSLLMNDYLTKKFFVKIVMLLLFGIGTIAYAHANNYWEYNPLIILFLLGTAFFSGITNFYYAILQGLEKFKYETFSTALLSFLSLIVIFAVTFRPSVAMFVACYSVATFIQMLVTHVMTSNAIKGFELSSFLGKIEPCLVRKELLIGFSFASIVITEILFSSFDTIFVENQYSQIDLGYYEGFKKLFMGLTIVAIILGAALFPTLSRLAQNENLKNLNKIFLMNIGMIGVGGIIFLIYFSLNELIISILLGENYMALSTWDFHIALITIATYVRVVPGLYFVGAKKETSRLLIIVIFLIVEIAAFYILLSSSSDIKEAIRLTTQVNVALTIVYSLYFAFLLLNSYNKLTLKHIKS